MAETQARLTIAVFPFEVLLRAEVCRHSGQSLTIGIIDSEVNLLGYVVPMLDGQLDLIWEKSVGIPGANVFGFCDSGGPIAGLGFLACQAYGKTLPEGVVGPTIGLYGMGDGARSRGYLEIRWRRLQ